MLKQETASGGLVTTSLHPGHIVGPGWHPVGPLGNLDPAVWFTLSAGEPLRIPGLGAELMHHVHADDVAQAFERAIQYPAAAAGWFGQSAALESVSWEEFRQSTTPEHAETSWEHLFRSHCASIEKARTLLGYAPRYEPDAAVLESVRWLIKHDELRVARPLSA